LLALNQDGGQSATRAEQTDLPDGLVMTDYLTVCDGKITSLIIIRNEPAY
jgi:hypothetical protein